jgi:hypothetical protein
VLSILGKAVLKCSGHFFSCQAGHREKSLKIQDPSYRRDDKQSMTYLGNNVMSDKIERIGFGIVADEDKSAERFAHADRFFVFDLKNRKEVIFREYRPNPYGEICKQKYPKPCVIGDNPSDEEVEIYRKMAEILKDCKSVWGKNFGNYVHDALSAVGVNPILSDRDPQEAIDSLIGARYLAGYRD